jgi:hypothetical protein
MKISAVTGPIPFEFLERLGELDRCDRVRDDMLKVHYLQNFDLRAPPVCIFAFSGHQAAGGSCPKEGADPASIRQRRFGLLASNHFNIRAFSNGVINGALDDVLDPSDR